jgi:O-antigen ligase
MNRERLDSWCERGIAGLVLVLVWWGSLGLGGVRPSEFLLLQGLTMLVMVLWLLRFWLHPRLHLFWPPVCWCVAAFVIYAVFRTHYADVEYVARQELMRVLLYAVLFLACLNNLSRPNAIRWVVYGLVLLGTLQASLAVHQFITHSPHIWGWLRPPGFLDRGSGTYICPNHLAGLLEMILPLALAYTVASRSSPVTRILLGYSSLVMTAGVVVSMSRGGWLAASFGLVILLALLARTPRQWIALAVLVLVLAGSGVFFYSRSISLQLRVDDVRRHLNRGLQHHTRYGMVAAAFRMWTDHPWFGVGPAHFDLRYRNYRAEHGLYQNRPGRVHNDYLNTLADWGVVGALLVALPFAATGLGLARHWHHLRKTRVDSAHAQGSVRPFLAGATAGLGAILLHSAFDFNMHIPANAIVAVVLLALLAGQVRFATERYRIVAHLPLRLAATLLLLAGLGFFALQGWKTWQEEAWLRRARSLPELSPERVAALQEAFAVEPGNAETANLVGEQYRLQSWQGGDDDLGQAEQAMSWFQRAMSLNPYNPLNHLGIAACLDWLGRYEAAEPWYAKALELDPHGHRTRAQMGWHCYLRGDYAGAVEWFKKTRSLVPDNPIVDTYMPLAWQKLQEQKKTPAPPKPTGLQ